MNDNGKPRTQTGLDFAQAARFLDRALSAGATLLELRSTGPEGQEPVCSWDLPGATVDEADDAAQNDAVGRSGSVRYILCAINPDGKVWGRHAFVLQAGAGNFAEENATLAGIVVECIRDKRDMTKMALGYTENLFGRFQEMLEFHGAVAAKSEEKHMQMLSLMEELISHKDERDTKRRENELTAETTRTMVRTFAPLIPAAANRLLGKFTGTPAPLGDHAMREFLKSFTPDQLAYFGERMTPEQLAAFSEMISTIGKEEETKERDEAKDREAYRAATVTNANGGIG